MKNDPKQSWFDEDAHRRRLAAISEQTQDKPKPTCTFCDTPLIRAVEADGVCANCETIFSKLIEAFDTIECLRSKGWVVQLDNGLDGTWEAQASKPDTETQYSPGNTFNDAITGVAVMVLKVENENKTR